MKQQHIVPRPQILWSNSNLYNILLNIFRDFGFNNKKNNMHRRWCDCLLYEYLISTLLETERQDCSKFFWARGNWSDVSWVVLTFQTQMAQQRREPLVMSNDLVQLNICKGYVRWQLNSWVNDWWGTVLKMGQV